MKANREIRLESLKRVLNGKWFGRMLIVMTIVCTVSNLANGVVDRFYSAKGIQTCGDYLIAKVQAMRAGLDYAVPSSAVAREMCGSTAFQMFIAFIFGGIVVYGMTSVVLKAAKEDENGWCSESMGGFSRPFGVAWLGFVLFVRIFLCSLLLLVLGMIAIYIYSQRWNLKVEQHPVVRIFLWPILFLMLVPGMIAAYRYSQCWNLKVEHPEWGASQCLAESERMMAGHKLQRFRLDLYFLVFSSAAILAVVPVKLVAMSVGGLLGGVLDTVSALYSMVAIVFMCLWISVARAVFYRELKVASPGA